jgi:Phage phiEco32-like COOH.NH2 ligase-type 2
MFGSDPEIFSRDAKGQIVPAYTFLPPKTKPELVEIHYQGRRYDAHIYNDGFQAELSASPHGCIAYVVDSIRGGLHGIWKKSNGASLVLDNAPQIPIDILRDAPEENVILGCDPSRNAYNMGGACVGDPRALRNRFTGFHIHISGWYVPNDMKDREKLFIPYVKALDSVLGVFFVAAGAHLESNKRREYYGLAGEYRLPDHGLEYRVLSSVVMAHPGIANLAFELARGVMALVNSNATKLWVADEQETIGVINSNNQKAARAIITRNKDLFSILTSVGRYSAESHRRWANGVYKLSQEGIDSIVKDPNDFVSNWKFNKNWHGHGEGLNESWRWICPK